RGRPPGYRPTRRPRAERNHPRGIWSRDSGCLKLELHTTELRMISASPLAMLGPLRGIRMTTTYPVTFNVDYPDRNLDRLTRAFRIVVAIPIVVVLSLLTGTSLHYVTTHNTTSETATLATGGGVLFLPLVLMIVFRQKYPRWWFDWNLQLLRFSNRISAYFALLDDHYPSTNEDKAVR